MRCDITVEWRDGEEKIELSRDKAPAEIWAAPGTRNVMQAIQTLDATYADIRAALVATLPPQEAELVSVIMNVTPEVARRISRGEK